MATISVILASVLLNCAAQICMKKGMMEVGEVIGGIQGFVSMIPSMLSNLYLWIAAGLYVISMALWLIVLSRVEVSYAYPFLSIGYVLSAVVAYVAFHENVTPVRALGILIICIGVVMISRS